MNVIFKDKNINNSTKTNQNLILIAKNRDKFKNSNTIVHPYAIVPYTQIKGKLRN